MADGVTITQKYRNRYAKLKSDSSDWISHWKQIADYMIPRRGKYLVGNKDEIKAGGNKHGKIINGAAGKALRTLAAGMQGGLTSPSRPWFVLELGDQELMEFSTVRIWLGEVRDRMLNIMARSNFYPSIHSEYEELGAFGVGAMLIDEDLETVIRCRPFTIGEYRLILDHLYRPSGMYRQFSMSAEQLVTKFGEGKVSQTVKSSFNNPSNMDARFEVLHVIEKKEQTDSRGFKYGSIYFEVDNDQDQFLRDSGYLSKPFVAPRWGVAGVNTYGDGPGHDALGDVKMLQKMEEKKLKALDKMVDPPMNAPLSMKGKNATIIAGGVNYIDVTAGAQSFAPSYMVNPDFNAIEFSIETVVKRIEGTFFNDLFLAVLGTDKEMTATEVAQRHEEKLLMLGPVIERLQSELLDVIIERVYSIMGNMGLLPPVPPELSGREIEIKYISLLAQAQRIVGLSSIQRTAEFVGGLAAIYPDVIDKFDADEAVDQYSRMLGVPPKIIVSDDKVAEKRAATVAAAATLAAQQQAAQAIESGKTMSETELNKNSALDYVVDQQGGGS